MSGGAYDYVCHKIDDITIKHADSRRILFQALLKLVAKAMHDIEWVDSGDYSDGDEYEAIDACFAPELAFAYREAYEEQLKLKNLMNKFKKKPVVITAHQWFKNGDHPNDQSEMIFTDGFLSEGKVVRYFRDPNIDGKQKCKYCDDIMHNHGWIDTMEGGHIVCHSDWVITGVRGEMYPCKNSIFLETYERI